MLVKLPLVTLPHPKIPRSMKSPATSSFSRRRFLQTTGAGLSFASPNLITTRKGWSDEQKIVIGSGEHTYECEHFWGTLPDDATYGNASHGVAFDDNGLIYITHNGGPDSVFVFDADGKFIKSLVPDHSKGKGRASGHGIDIRKEADGKEYLYLSPADPAMAFTKATMDGEVIWTRGKAELEKDSGHKLAKYRPTNASFAPNDDVYLGDGYGSGMIFRYTGDGEFVSCFGGTGTEDGKFNTPHGQWFDARDGMPKIVICDRANMRLQWFDMDNDHLKTMDVFLFPADIDIQGELLLVSDLHSRLTILNKEDKVIAQLGDDEAWRNRCLDKSEKMRASPDKWQDGKFVHPHDAAFDKEGNIFVAEWVVGGRVTKLRKVS